VKKKHEELVTSLTVVFPQRPPEPERYARLEEGRRRARTTDPGTRHIVELAEYAQARYLAPADLGYRPGSPAPPRRPAAGRDRRPGLPGHVQDLVFPAGQPTDATYVFNSWRLTWYWRFASTGKWSFRLGATLKVRDAEIGLSGAPGSSVKDDLGLVPLLYAYARYQASDRLAFEAEADALAAPQGRAEDVSVKAVLRVRDSVDLDVGYRLLEGGADNDEVYTFAFFHYEVAGVRVRF
jgi:hypothetical protein